MELRAEERATTGQEQDRASAAKRKFIEPELIERGTLPEITWFPFSSPLYK